MKELRAMFETTSYFDSEQITSILMVIYTVSLQISIIFTAKHTVVYAAKALAVCKLPSLLTR